jgi:hypothetical protein
LAVVSPAKAPRTVRFCAAPTRRYNHLPVGVHGFRANLY